VIVAYIYTHYYMGADWPYIYIVASSAGTLDLFESVAGLATVMIDVWIAPNAHASNHWPGIIACGTEQQPELNNN
jgi:hypothetical protein